jgi:hypothetical protein
MVTIHPTWAKNVDTVEPVEEATGASQNPCLGVQCFGFAFSLLLALLAASVAAVQGDAALWQHVKGRKASGA